MDEVFKALADPTRRAILERLKAGESSAGELAEHFPLAKSTLSGHFRKLSYAGLIASRKEGATVYYRLNTTVMQDALTRMLSLLGEGEEQRPAAVRMKGAEHV